MYVVSWRTCATCAQLQQGILYPGTRKALEDLAMEASVWRSPAAASCAVTTPNRIPGSSFAGTQLSGRAWSCYSGSGFGLCRGLQLSFMGHLPVNSPAPDNRVVGAVAQIAAVRDEIKAVLRRYTFADLSDSELKDLQARPRIDFTTVYDRVRPIIDDVHTRRDAAVKEYTAKFDKVKLDNVVDLVHELPDPVLDPDVRAAFDVAYANIYKFHAAQQKSQQLEVSTMQGVSCRRVARSINSVGLYVPGGTAVLPSTALMLAVPAQIAGCKTVIIATPPRPDGSTCPEVLYCAKKAGAKYILKAGGAQAIAAMAWGTESCPKVDKILGPGNQYVTAAKMLLQNSEAMISIDMPAGPSEVLVIADKHASPVHLAADLLSQAEHGPDSQVVLVAVGDVDIGAIERELNKQCNALPRGDTAAQALAHSFTVIAADMDEACAFSNLYAPEHLIVNVDDAEKWLDKLENAGSVFLGKWTPESVGDYASGTNHVLPTYGYARMYAGVSLDSFVRYMTVQSLTKEGLQLLGPSVEKMAEVEGLDAHKRAVSLRLRDIEALVV